ncbi:golgin subfamily A member 4 isoform X3 [Amblyraja radiata]|uniref:golgin subfamily A member 4 isoform X3 n=1 Tax=Amblyraja radiata TaxID=386614 RepID=UPI0014023A58|nr:golgin subfamily A member 4 isoform X3 [Amblyraja radiata]
MCVAAAAAAAAATATAAGPDRTGATQTGCVVAFVESAIGLGLPPPAVMFKKLKQKINEEQSPSRSGQAQASPKSTPSSEHDSSLSGQHNEATFTPGDRELLAEMIAEPAFLSEYTIFALESTKWLRPLNINVNMQKTADQRCSPKGTDNLNDDGSAAGQKTDLQSFVQKRQFRAPSLENLFRASSKESVFSSPSKESLLRTASRDSLNRIDADAHISGAIFDPSSDIESETEDSAGTFESLSRDPSSNQFRRMERSLGNYRFKYSELVTAYRTLQRDKEKMQVVLSQGQDKALRRIGELREELQMIQQAKKHIQDEFEASLEEKDQFIGVLQTQVMLLKQRSVLGGESVDLQEPTDQDSVKEHAKTTHQSSYIEENSADDPDGFGEGAGDGANSLVVLQKRVKRQENLLQRCKEMIHVHKERCTQVTSENETLQEQLDERYQELEKIKDLHTTEKTKLITQLRDAKNLIEQLEQDKGMVIAETKRQMHETLEMKEEEVSQLRVRIQQCTGQREDLLEQKEKSDRAAFEELERALVAAQKSEDKCKRLKEKMGTRITAVEQAGEEERKNMQQELKRVKQEAVNIMKKSSEDYIGELEKSQMEALTCKEREFEHQLLVSKQEFQEQLKMALDKSHAEYREQQEEKEQQTMLALEEQELQREAIQAQAAKQIQELQGELETCRTRVLELESLLVQTSQGSEMKSEDIEAEKAKYKEEMRSSIEKHQMELQNKNQEEEQLSIEKLHQQQAKVEELEKRSGELEAQLMENETQFHAHIEEMNQKTLEKIDLKQTELEELSVEMSEILKVRQELENKLSLFEEDVEKKLKQKEMDCEEKINAAEKNNELAMCGVEKIFTEKLNNLHHLLEEKDKELQELQTEKESLTNQLETIQNEAAAVSVELEIMSQARKCELENAREKMTCELDDQRRQYEVQLTELQNLVKNLETDKSNLCRDLEEKEKECLNRLHEVTVNLDNYKLQAQDFKDLEEKNSDLLQKIVSLTEQYESRIAQLGFDIALIQKGSEENQKALNEALNLQKQQAEEFSQQHADKQKQYDLQVASLHEEYGEKIRTLETKLEKITGNEKEMQENFQVQLSEQEIKLKVELEKKQTELIQKEQILKEKIMEMAHTNSTGINETVAQLESSQKQLESLNEMHKIEVAELNQSLVNRLDQQMEELKEKHENEIQEKEQEFTKLKRCLEASNNDKDKLSSKVEELTGEVASRADRMQQLQEASCQVDALLKSEIILKTRLETLEETASQALLARTELENTISELKNTHEQSQERIRELNCLLKETEDKLQLLETLRGKENDEHEKALQAKSVEIENEIEFRNQIEQVIHCFNEADGKIELQINTFSSFCFDKISNLSERIKVYQTQFEKMKKAFMKKNCEIRDLETQVHELINQNVLLNDSVQHITQQLQNKEQDIKALQGELQIISADRDTLQQDSKLSKQLLNEKEAHIEHCKTELAENANMYKFITQQLEEKESNILSFEDDIRSLKLQLEHHDIVVDKEAISLLNEQHQVEQQKLLNQIDQLSASIEAISQEKISALGQVDQYKNKLAEWKKRTEIKFAQHSNKMKELESNLMMSVQLNEEKDGQLSSLRAEVEKLTNSLQNGRNETEHAENEKTTLVTDLNGQLQAAKSRIAELDQDIATKSQQCEIEEINKKLHQKEIELEEMRLQLEQAQAGASEQYIKFKDTENKIKILEQEMESLTVGFLEKQNEWEKFKLDLKNNKEQDLKDLETRVKTESATKIAELKRKAEQKIAKIRKQLTDQMEGKEKCMDEQLKDLKQKVTFQDTTNEALEEKLKSLEAAEVEEKEEKEKVVKMREELELEKENCLKVFRASYEEKVTVLQMELSARDEIIQKYKETSVKTDNFDEITQLQANIQDHLEIVGAEKIEQRQSELEQQKHVSHSLSEKEKMDKLDNLMLQMSTKDKRINEMEKRIEELQRGKEMTEKQMMECQGDVTKDDTEIDGTLENSSITEGYKKDVKLLQEQLQEKVSLLKIFEESSEEKSKSDLELFKLLDDTRAQQSHLGRQLEDTENEKQKLRKEHTKLQKDLRALRKEHEAELEIIRKEINEEAEKTTKLELEDLQLKHNSILKQLLREFNTQLAKKEQELDVSVKEAIGKAQEVEAELLETHKEEVNQLYRKTAEKDDYLKRTVNKYEEILQTREEEMTVKVNELQMKLEELEAKHQLCDEGHLTATELQAQLAQKTSLLSDATLQEQDFREQIHSLEDQLGVQEKHSCLSPFKIQDGDGNYTVDGSVISVPTEVEYLKKVLYEYMMGKETKTLAKVITTVLKFPADQTQKILEREESRSSYSSPRTGIF